MFPRKYRALALVPLLLFFHSSAQIRLPRLFRDSMVLQRDAGIHVWGWASAGERVALHWNGHNYHTRTSPAGNWSIVLPPMPAGGPYTLELTGRNRITLHEILIGDVWLCSGQSNMVLPMERVKEKYPQVIAEANYSSIRQFFIPTLTSFQGPKDDLPSGNWVAADPKTVLDFSATAFFFAKALFEKYHVPIGIINASVGGTPIQAWISESGLEPFASEHARVESLKDINVLDPLLHPHFARGPRQVDQGLLGHWYDSAFMPQGWHPIDVPGYWSDEGIRGLNGVVWYRREIDVPPSMTGVIAKLFLGRIVDADFAYVNGVQVGNITYQYPPRRYVIPPGILHPGKNILVVRIINTFGKGGFVPDKNYSIEASGQRIDLEGRWEYKVGEVFERTGFAGAPAFTPQYQPAVLFNAMIAPLIPYTLKGFLWYQGEANADRPSTYQALLRALIGDWRARWGQGELPFLYVQLPGFQDATYTPGESNWAELREAERKTLEVPRTGMAVTIDIGEWNDIHPLDKGDVGRRLALEAERLAYGDSAIVASGPLYRSAYVSGNRVVLKFADAGTGLVAVGGEPAISGAALSGEASEPGSPCRFAVAGADHKFVWAQGEIAGDSAVVWSPAVPDPVYVRYAWADNPVGANLYNREGLPASPFETGALTPGATAGAGPWNGKSCAVVLTYDDALNVDLDNAIPLLDSLGLKATFYLSGYSGALDKRMSEWRAIAREGHELGNHTLYHPCSGSLPGRSFVTPETNLDLYTVHRMDQEILMTNALLRAIDGKDERTFAYPCGDMKIGDTSYLDPVKNAFIAARGVQSEMSALGNIDLYKIGCYAINGQSGDDLVKLVRQAMEGHRLLVFLFHGVGGGHSLNVSLDAHSELLHFLKDHEQEIWIAPMIDVAEFIRQAQGGH